MCGNDEAAMAALRAAGNRLVDAIQELRRRERPKVEDVWRCQQFAYTMVEDAFGVLPIQDGPERLDPEAIRRMVPRLEGAADLVESLLKTDLCKKAGWRWPFFSRAA